MARKILLADDSVTAQNMGRKILTDAGYEVVTVNNGSAALKKMAESKPDLIVLDVYMPGYSGLEVCQRIKENRDTARIPILLTVGKLEPFKPEEARRARADAFVVKPFEASELLAALTKLEDKIVPQPEPYKPGRFAKAIASVDPDAGEKFGDTDDGWKARLQIPKAGSKPSENEPEVDYTANQGKGFRDFKLEETPRRGRGKTHVPEAPPERPLPAGLPHDITPEEIAALTAAAARLNAPPTPAPPKDPAPLAGEVSAQEAAEESAPVTFASAPEIQTAEAVASPVEIEVNGAAASEETSQPPHEAVVASHADPELAESAERVSEVAAPVPDIEAGWQQAAVAKAQAESVRVEPLHVEAVVPAMDKQEAAAQAKAESAPAPVNEPETVAAPVPVVSEPEPRTVTQVPQPDDDVMAALQSLMPADSGSRPIVGTTDRKISQEDVPAGFAAVVATAESVTIGAHSVGPRWVAQEVPLAPGDGTLSLEREMQKAYAAFAAQEAVIAASALAVEPEAMVGALEPDVASAEVDPEVISEAAPQPVEEQPVVHAMATAAGGDGATVISTVVPTSEATVMAEVAQRHAQEMPLAVSAAPGSAQIVPEGNEWSTASAGAMSEEAGGTEDMVAQWKNIRDSTAGSAAKPAPAKDECKEPEPEVASAPLVAEKAHTASGATDPSAIASIVDSVLAELRPKIVEEIAKKLGDTKKG